MFAPVLDDDDEEDDLLRQLQNDEVVRVRFAEDVLGVVIIKINYILLLLSLGVACFIQFSTLEPQYLNALMWGPSSEESSMLPVPVSNSTSECEWHNQTLLPQQKHEEELLSSSSSTIRLIRTLQSISAILLLCFLRVVIFPDLHRNTDNNATTSTLEAVLADMLFHIKCRLGIGFLACLTPLPLFATIETTVICLSLAVQIATTLGAV